MNEDRNEPALYVAIVERGNLTEDPLEGADKMRLADGLFLVRTEATRSQLYHALKRQTKPDSLFVARLDGAPKFKGMAAGALKWLRSR